ncbi:hypothetical protein D3C72_2221880 [compost metagenome]
MCPLEGKVVLYQGVDVFFDAIVKGHVYYLGLAHWLFRFPFHHQVVPGQPEDILELGVGGEIPIDKPVVSGKVCP